MSEEGNKTIDNKSTTKFCISCGEEICEGQKFCSKCGKDINENTPKAKKVRINKKYVYIFCGIILFVIVAISMNFYIKEQKQQEARKEYLTIVKDFQEQSIIAGTNLEDIADTIQTYWHENIFDDKHGSDIDSAILYAMIDKSSEIEKAEKYDEELLELYRNLKAIPEGSEDLADILKTTDNLYNSYTDYYSFATDPSGNYTQFSSDNNTKTDEFASSYRALSNLIKSSSELEQIKSTSENIRGKMNNVMKEYNSISEAMPKNLDPTNEKVDEEFKKIVEDYASKKEIDVSDIEKESKKFEDDESISNAIEIVLSTKESYNNMIKYAKSYKKSNSQKNLDEFKSAVYDFRSHVAMYVLHVDALDGEGESLKDKL